MDTLHIKGLNVATKIGVHHWEQQILQTLLIDITIPTHLKSLEDNLEKTIDYDTLSQQVTLLVEVNSFKLIETVAEQVALFIQKEFNIEHLTVAVSKPQAIKNASNVTVTYTL